MAAFCTISEIAAESGFKVHQVRYLIKRAAISPTYRAGDFGMQLFDTKSVRRIIKQLRQTSRRATCRSQN